MADFRFAGNAMRRTHPGFRVALRDFHTRTIHPDAGIQARAVGEAVRSRSHQRILHENEITAFPIRCVTRPSR